MIYSEKQFIEERSKQKNAFSNFTLNVPDASIHFLKDNELITFDTLCTDFIITKHKKYYSVKDIHIVLQENYEREFGDLLHFCDPDLIYLIATPLLKSGLQKSSNYKFIGFVSVYSDIVQVIWIHPFFRNRGLITKFFIHYAEYENLLSLQPPLTKGMQAAGKKVEEYIKNNLKIKKTQAKFLRNYLIRNSPNAKIDLLTDEELYKVKEGIMVWQAICTKKELHEISKMIHINTEMVLYMKNHPDQIDEIKQWVISNCNVSSIKKSLYDFVNIGR